MDTAIDEILTHHGIKPTANRVLVLRTIHNSPRPLSLADIESELDTLERSSIFRVLMLLLRHGVVHTVEDGRGVVNYEECHSDHPGHCEPEELHAHFYCEQCHQLTCLTDVPVPHVDLPEGYKATSANYIIKGLCPKCNTNHNQNSF